MKALAVILPLLAAACALAHVPKDVLLPNRVASACCDMLPLEQFAYDYDAAGNLNTRTKAGLIHQFYPNAANELTGITRSGTLAVRHATAPRYRVTWGDTSKSYAAAELEKGVNLAADFPTNPFSAAFNRVDEAVAKKQAYETRQVKELFHGPEGKADLDATAALTEKVRAPLAASVRRALKPVKHTLRIEAE